MSMSDWAAEEVRIACERRRAAIIDTECDVDAETLEYAEGCYQSALKAYNALCDDEHSGMSFHVTVDILKRLCSGYPLTPIEDVDNVWELVHETPTELKYQCRRMHSLFKTVSKETGSVQFCDHNRFLCVDPKGITYTNNFINRQLSKLYPLTFPYMPAGKFVVSVVDFDTNANPGEFDTILIRSVKEPDGHEVLLNLRFKETENGFEQIERGEYEERYHKYRRNLEAQAKTPQTAEVDNDPAVPV